LAGPDQDARRRQVSHVLVSYACCQRFGWRAGGYSREVNSKFTMPAFNSMKRKIIPAFTFADEFPLPAHTCPVACLTGAPVEKTSMKSKSAPSAQSNPAVLRCCRAWDKAYQRALDTDEQEDADEEAAERQADCAYREAMPPLDGIRNARDFIACITYGCMIGAIDGADYSRFLYAVQVIHTTRRVRKPKAKTARKETPSEAPKTTENAPSTPFAAPVMAA